MILQQRSLFIKVRPDLIYQTRNEAADEDVAFLQLKDLVIETYQNNRLLCVTSCRSSCYRCEKHSELFGKVCQAGYTLITDIRSIVPFWENG